MTLNRELANKTKRPVLTVLNGHDQSEPESQLGLPFNLIKIDKGLFLAPRGAPANRVMTVKKADPFMQELLDDFGGWMVAEGRITGKRGIRRESYFNALSMLLANAKHAYHRKGQVVIGRRKTGYSGPKNPQNITPYLTNPLLEYMAHAGLIDYVVGKNNDKDSNSSWFIPLESLNRRIQDSEIRTANGSQRLILRDRDKQPKAWSLMGVVQRQVKRMTADVDAYNRMMMEHTITLGKAELFPYAYRVFTHSIDLGGRIYSGWQSTPKADRGRIRIDGSCTAELDYKAMHWAMLYAQCGLAMLGDPYEVEGQERDTIKLISLVLLNTTDLNRLATQITWSGTREAKEISSDYEKRRWSYERDRRRNLKAREPKAPDALEAFIKGVPDGSNGPEIVQSILDRHKPIAHLLGTDDIGLKLQNADSHIMAECLRQATELNIPCLPLHDSLICLTKDQGIIYGIMKTVFHDKMRQNATITGAAKWAKSPQKTLRKPQ